MDHTLEMADTSPAEDLTAMASSRISSPLTALLLMMVLLLPSSTARPTNPQILREYENVLYNQLSEEKHKSCSGVFGASDHDNITFSITIGNKKYINTLNGFYTRNISLYYDDGYHPIMHSLYQLSERMPQSTAAKNTMVLLRDKCHFHKRGPTTTTVPITERKRGPTTTTIPITERPDFVSSTERVSKMKKNGHTRFHGRQTKHTVQSEYRKNISCHQLLELAELWRIFIVYGGLPRMPCT